MNWEFYYLPQFASSVLSLQLGWKSQMFVLLIHLGSVSQDVSMVILQRYSTVKQVGGLVEVDRRNGVFDCHV